MTTSYPFPVFGDEFKGKRILVTGGTKGMGEAMVRRFQLSGAVVATVARSPLPQDQAPDLFVKADVGTVAGRERDSRAHSEEVGWTRRSGQ
jgi:NAD(P)-dependent dehydrogenase (short-subunit alcohol dehydrogenase family)